MHMGEKENKSSINYAFLLHFRREFTTKNVYGLHSFIYGWTRFLCSKTIQLHAFALHFREIKTKKERKKKRNHSDYRTMLALMSVSWWHCCNWRWRWRWRWRWWWWFCLMLEMMHCTTLFFLSSYNWGQSQHFFFCLNTCTDILVSKKKKKTNKKQTKKYEKLKTNVNIIFYASVVWLLAYCIYTHIRTYIIYIAYVCMYVCMYRNICMHHVLCRP